MPNMASVVVTQWSRRLLAAAGVLVFFAAAGCAQTPFQQSGALEYDRALLTGERVFGQRLGEHELPWLNVNEASEDMLAYVEQTVRSNGLASQRFRDLFSGLNRDGYFQSVYSANSTLTAAQTFAARGGNCLSYTNMFVALARAANLDARYQVVDVPPTWDADSGFLIRYTHINVLLKGVRLDNFQSAQDVIIDFNVVHPDPEYPRKVVPDEYAESLFYANQSVNLLREKRPRESFAYLRRAIDIAPENVDLWINLGAFYATLGDFQSSLEAYDVALQIDPRNKAAYSGLARNYANVGNQEMAAVYEAKVRNYRERNPYYHYAMAQAAFEEADFATSLAYINTAIDLRRRIARFHFLKGLVEQRMGDTEAAEESLARAERYGLDRTVKLDLLRSLAGVNAS